MLTRGLTRLRARTIWIAALTVAALWSATDLRAQLPMPAATPFEMVGFIQSATLEDGTDPFRGGTITINNHKVIVPRNTIFQQSKNAGSRRTAVDASRTSCRRRPPGSTKSNNDLSYRLQLHVTGQRGAPLYVARIRLE